MNSKPWFLAARAVVLISATVHVTIVVLIALFRQDIALLNYFRILELDLLFPAILSFNHSTLLSFGVGLLLYTVTYTYYAQQRGGQNQ